MRAISLVYHDAVEAGHFASSGFQLPGADHYKLDVRLFEAHLVSIRDAGLGPPETVDGPPPRRPSMIPLYLTFDDGGASGTRIGDILAGFGWRGHFLVPSAFIGKPGFLTEREIRDLASAGHVIGSHSHTHPPRMAILSRRDLEQEWKESASILAQIVGKAVTTASVPFGSYSGTVAGAAASAGLTHLFTSEPVKRSWTVGSCVVLGRYSVVRSHAPIVSARLACPRATASQLRQCVSWNARKGLKRTLGPVYDAVRRHVLD